MAALARAFRFARLVAMLLPALVFIPHCRAHPMGNFSINHYAGLQVQRGSVELRYIIDFAEIPTYQNMQDAGIVPHEGDPSLPPFLAKAAALWSRNLVLEVNGEPVRLTAVSRTVIFPPGAGGLPTMKVALSTAPNLSAAQAGGQLRIHYVDENFAGHAGWKEIVVTAGPGVEMAEGAPFRVDRSAQLTDYPTSLLNSPPQDLEARFEVSVVGGLPPRIAQGALGTLPELAPATPPVTTTGKPVTTPKLSTSTQAVPSPWCSRPTSRPRRAAASLSS